MSALEVHVRVRRGAFTLEVDLEVPAAGVLGLFGPSGSGKTTLLRCLAGLEPRAEGVVRLGASTWQDGERVVFVPPHRRGAAYVFQENDLFPHLDVERNLRYALKRARGPSPRREDVLDWLGIGPLLPRRVDTLSGGERQRVSLARALLSGPRLLLLDEPLSALDEPGRREVLPYLEALTARFSTPVVYVSHALQEVAHLSDLMIWLVDGGVRGVGPPTELLGRVDFALWRGSAATVVVDAVVVRHHDGYGLTELGGPWGPIWVRRQPRSAGEPVRVQIEASDVSLSLEPQASSSVLNRFPLRVLSVGDAGTSEVLVRLGSGEEGGAVLLARVTRLSSDRLGIVSGSVVHAGVKSVAVVG